MNNKDNKQRLDERMCQLIDALGSDNNGEINGDDEALAIQGWQRVQDYVHEQMSSEERQRFESELMNNNHLAILVEREMQLTTAIQDTHISYSVPAQNINTLFDRINSETTPASKQSPSSTQWRAFLDSIPYSMHDWRQALKRPISRGVSAFAIFAMIGVSFAHDINTRIYQALLSDALPNDYLDPVVFSSRSVLRLTFANNTTPDDMNLVLSQFRFRPLSPVSRHTEILVMKLGDIDETTKTSMLDNPHIESIELIRQEPW